MKQEYIDLLRKDIAARLPYEPIVTNERFDGGFGHRLHLGDLATSKYFDSIYIEDTKVYLRSMSSMTEEEKEELHKLHFSIRYEDWLNRYVKLVNYTYEDPIIKSYPNQKDYIAHDVNETTCANLIDWLNAHHFDYRGLIEKGLAIEVTEENNPYVHRTYADMMKSKNK